MKHHWQCKICGKAGAVKSWFFSDSGKILKKLNETIKRFHLTALAQ